MKVTIDVTKEIIEETKMCGKQPGTWLSNSCAVAVAAKSVLGDVAVANTIILMGRYTDTGECPVIDLPKWVWNWIIDFDSKEPEERVLMYPIAFQLEVEDKYVINQ